MNEVEKYGHIIMKFDGFVNGETRFKGEEGNVVIIGGINPLKSNYNSFKFDGEVTFAFLAGSLSFCDIIDNGEHVFSYTGH